MQESRINFGIICTGMTFPSWQARTIDQLLGHPQIQLKVLIIVPEEKEKEVPFSEFFWKAFYAIYVKKRAKAFRAEDRSAQLGGTPQMLCSTSSKETDGIHFTADDLQRITGHQLDFILHFGTTRLQGGILNAARFGVWTFQFGDQTNYGGTPPCFWEIFYAERVTHLELVRLTEQEKERLVLKSGCLKTKMAYAKNIDQAFFESVRWPVQICIDLLHNQLEKLEASPSPSIAPVRSNPSNLQMIAFFAKLSLRYGRKAFKSLCYTDYWNIGVAQGPITAFLDPDTIPPVHWFPHLPKSKFIADPFGVMHRDRLHIIYEDFRFDEGLGTIGTFEFKPEGFSEESIEIKEPFHLSYPFTFEYENEFYAIPESYQAGEVRLYKAVDFPHKWSLEKVLIENFAGIDNTLFSYDGYWWMFSNDKSDGVHHNLKIHYAKDVFGPWQAHSKNPVKTDIRSSRPAGSIFQHQGAIFRPSMDYSEKVEGRITINKILKLSTTDFREEAHTVLDPFPDTYYSDKVHTLSAAGKYTIVDGAKELFIFNNVHAFRYQLRKQWRKLTKRMGFT